MPGTLKSRHHNTWTGRLTGQRLNVSMSSRVADKDDPRPKAACVGTMAKLKRADKLAIQLGRCCLPFTALRQPPVDRWMKKELGRLMVWVRDRLARIATMHGEDRQFLMDDDYFTHLPPEPLRGWVLGAAEKGISVEKSDAGCAAYPEYYATGLGFKPIGAVGMVDRYPAPGEEPDADYDTSEGPTPQVADDLAAVAMNGVPLNTYMHGDDYRRMMKEMHHPIPLTPEEMDRVEDSINACRTKMDSPGKLTYNGAVKAHLQLIQRLIERVTGAPPPSQEELKDMGMQWQDLIRRWCFSELRRLEHPELNDVRLVPRVLQQWMNQQEKSQ